MATSGGHSKTVALLLEKGADKGAKDKVNHQCRPSMHSLRMALMVGLHGARPRDPSQFNPFIAGWFHSASEG